jgi:hypothetical protein
MDAYSDSHHGSTEFGIVSFTVQCNQVSLRHKREGAESCRQQELIGSSREASMTQAFIGAARGSVHRGQP